METKVFLLSLVPFLKKYPDSTKREIEKLAGEYLLKTVSVRLLGCETLEICREGKPYIKDCPFHFNISHSGDWLLLAIGDVPVGADIEKITKIRPKIAEKYFLEAEQERVIKEGRNAFFEIWTQKESYVKYTGEGIRGMAELCAYPDEVAFFTRQYEGYRITVCTKKEHLPTTIEISDDPL